MITRDHRAPFQRIMEPHIPEPLKKLADASEEAALDIYSHRGVLTIGETVHVLLWGRREASDGQA